MTLERRSGIVDGPWLRGLAETSQKDAHQLMPPDSNSDGKGSYPGSIWENEELVGFMRARAESLLSRSNAPTLQPTVLLNEAYLRLSDGELPEGLSESHAKAVLARVLRCVLVDYVRSRNTAKRGGERRRVPLSDDLAISASGEIDCGDIHEALDSLGQVDARAAQVVELRFFAGLAIANVAEVLGVSERTVASDWRYAQAWLRDRIWRTES